MQCRWFFPLLLCSFELYSTNWAHLLNQHVTYHVISGVPFWINLPLNTTSERPLPPCIRLSAYNETFDVPTIQQLFGFCLIVKANNTNEMNADSLKTYHINFLSNPPNRTIYNLSLHIQLSEAWRSRNPDDHTSSNFSTSHKCHKRPPTIAMIFLHRPSTSDSIDTIPWDLWKIIRRFILPKETDSVVQTDAIGLPNSFIKFGLHISNEGYDKILRNLQILATAEAKNFTELSNPLVVNWRIGCGSIEPKALEPLALLEEKFQNAALPVQSLPVENVSKLPDWKIFKWIVGDLVLPSQPTDSMKAPFPGNENPRTIRSVPENPLFSSYLPTAGLEGSGLLSPFANPYLNPITSDRHFLQPISPVKVTVHQITNVQIPSTTFLGVGAPHQLEVSLHLPRTGNNLTLDQVRSAMPDLFSPPISRDPNEWISFDPKSRIVRLRPLPQQVGEHQLILCAETQEKLRACEPFILTVRRPPPFRKNFILRVPPGIFWCYQIPIYWFEELKVQSFDNLDLKVTGDAPFSWNMQTAEVCIITHLKTEQIHTIRLLASNNEIAQSVEVEFRLSAKIPKVQSLLAFSKLRLKLQWTDTNKPYQLSELMRVNASLAQTLRVRVNPMVSTNNLFVYDVLEYNTPDTQTYPALLEIEWVFLPFGLPSEVGPAWMPSINDWARPEQSPGLRFGQTNRDDLVSTLADLIQKCKESNLDGAELAVHAAKDSFRPFVVLSAKLLELTDSLCQKATNFTRKPEMATFSASKSFGVQPGEMRPLVNAKVMPEVINNFTVTAGVSFKKSIHPERASPLKRIQFMELITLAGEKLDDSAWLGLTNDNTQLFGLPLLSHIRKQPYVFGLNIYSIDQKTPICVSFTIEVVNGFTTESFRPSDQPFPNHRVRLRILPFKTKKIWSITPIQSLNYRWQLSTAIDRFLRPNCPLPCNPDVGLWDLSSLDEHAILVVWAQLSILSEGVSTNLPSVGSNPNCPWEKISKLQEALTFAPSLISAEKNRGLVTGYAGDQQLFLAPWAAPAKSFQDHLERMNLGRLEAAVVDRMGPCARTPVRGQNGLENVASAANRVKADEEKFTIYAGEGFRYSLPGAVRYKSSQPTDLQLYDMNGRKIGSSNWIGLEKDQTTVFGILMGNAVQPTTYRFRVATSATDPNGVQFSVFVAGSNPDLPAVLNHRVIVRFGTDGLSRWIGGHSLLDRWRLVVSLDNFLRPQCVDKVSCQNSMDVLLKTFNYQAHGFTVIWAQKSLLMRTSIGRLNDGRIGSFEQQKHWDSWIEKKHAWSAKHRVYRRELSRGVHLKRSALYGCPEEGISELERKLIADSGLGYAPHPEFARHLKFAGVGVVKEISLERLGPCKQANGNIPLVLPEPPILVHNHSSSPWKSEQYPKSIDFSEASHFQPKKQQVLLLSTLIPGCLLLILILLGILTFVCYRKRSNSRDQNAEKAPTTDWLKQCADSRLCPNLFEKVQRKRKTETEEEVMLTEKPDAMHNMAQKTTSKSKVTGHNQVNGIEDTNSAPTRPLILPNERPPLKPQDFNFAYAESGISRIPGNTQSNVPVHSPFPSQTLTGQPKFYYGGKPDPYRNLPPPIDLPPGSVPPMQHIPYMPCRKGPGP